MVFCFYFLVKRNLVRSGRHSKMFSSEGDYTEYLWEAMGASRHMTFIFNLFVCL